MPNWCENKLTVENITADFIEYLNAEGFSFAKMAPIEDQNGDIEQKLEQISSWGTKWDLDDDAQEAVAATLISDGVAWLHTAWTPPIEALTALSQKFREVVFTLAYYEGGCEIWGICEIHDGRAFVDSGQGDEQEAYEFRQKYMDYDEEDYNIATGYIVEEEGADLKCETRSRKCSNQT